MWLLPFLPFYPSTLGGNMTTTIDPAGLLRSTAEAALNGDTEAAAWLRVAAPDLAEDERRLRAWVEWQKREDARQAALRVEALSTLLNAGQELDGDWELAGELDHYLETIHEGSFNYPD